MEWIERFGTVLRLFHVNVCSKYSTKELEHEGQKGVRREATTRTGTEQGSSRPIRGGVIDKEFSMTRPKLHFLGDYTRCILQYGTTDSYTTAIVSYNIYL